MPRLAPLAVPLALACLAGLSGPAHAESSTVEDVARDVTYGQRGSDIPPGTAVEPGTDGEPSADLRTATLMHGANRIRVVVRVRRYEPGDEITPNAAVWMRTPDGRVYRVNRTVSGGGGPYSGVFLQDENGDGEDYVCTADGRRSPSRAAITYAFDRDCLGDPEWLRFGAATANSSDGVSSLLVDDARREGGYGGARARIGGPRVYAGRRP